MYIIILHQVCKVKSAGMSDTREFKINRYTLEPIAVELKNAFGGKSNMFPPDLLGLQWTDNLCEQHRHRWAQCTWS